MVYHRSAAPCKGIEAVVRSHGGLWRRAIGGLLRLPWWLGVALAAAAYLWLHPYAQMAGSVPRNSEGWRAAIPPLLLQKGALWGQYLLPLTFALGACFSWLARRRRARLLAGVAAASGREALFAPSWREFELLVGELFRRQGYRVRELGGAGPDGGIDLELRRAGALYLVQCKQWRSQRVGVKPVRELAGLVATHRAAGGFLVAAGEYTAEAEAFARQAGIVLLRGSELKQEINAVAAAAESLPRCPRCGSPMVQRTARQGALQGQPFWGCSRFPECRGTRPMA